MSKQQYTHTKSFKLESGKTLPSIQITYHTYGKLNKEKNNVVWVCHALTANSDVLDWWAGLFGEGCLFDPKKYFIICANILGSCYGTTGPTSINPKTEKAYFHSFPDITIRDMVNAHMVLRKYLNIEKINYCVGGSMGGYQALEWAAMEPNHIEKLILTTTGAAESAWGIAIHTAQRLALETDSSFKKNSLKAGANGLKTARAIGMLTYRSYEQFVKSQTDTDGRTSNFSASTYIHYQGEKLVKRFNAHTYWTLTKAMDSHNLARKRGNSLKQVLGKIKTPALVVGISSDFLCPVNEQKFLAKHLPKGIYKEIQSEYGHDGFLIETKKLAKLIKPFITK